MNETGQRILQHLAVVENERAAREADAALARRALAIKSYQQARFARTHAGLLAHPRYAPAAGFFLEELYGPRDFAMRDAQFARIVPALVRLFPDEMVETVERLAALHALSERLDSSMARHLEREVVTRASYVRAWQLTAEPAGRARQIELVMEVGISLDRYTRNRLLRGSLHLMRAPARAAGLGSLQEFLEAGFDAFAAMKGAADFLVRIEGAERALMLRLFEPAAVASATAALAPDDVLGQLP
jgi:hypothetical protein